MTYSVRELTHAQKRKFLTALRNSHKIDVIVRVYDRNEDFITDLDAKVVNGQVDADDSTEISRSLSIEIQDQRNKFNFAPMGKVYADNFLSAHYRVWVEDITADGEWVSSPIFFGPVSRYQRDGHHVSIEAVGKESLLLPPVKHVPLGTPTNRKVAAYIRTAASRFGETKFDLGAARGVKVPKSFQIAPKKARENGVWWYLQKLAQSAGFRLFYDGRGYLTLKRTRKRTPYTFHDPLSEPVVGYDLAEFRNQVRVFGENENGRVTLRALATLKASHPLSPQSLARNGVPRFLTENLTFDNVRLKKTDATVIARDQLQIRAREVVDVQFDHLVVPHLELGDSGRLHTESVNVEFPLKKFTIPFSAGDSMSIGYTKPQRRGKFRADVRRVRRSS